MHIRLTRFPTRDLIFFRVKEKSGNFVIAAIFSKENLIYSTLKAWVETASVGNFCNHISKHIVLSWSWENRHKTKENLMKSPRNLFFGMCGKLKPDWNNSPTSSAPFKPMTDHWHQLGRFINSKIAYNVTFLFHSQNTYFSILYVQWDKVYLSRKCFSDTKLF